MIKKFASLLFTGLVLLATCCGGAIETPEDIEPKENVLQFTLLADSNLQEDTKIAIMDALAEWDIRVGERIGYSVLFKNMSNESRDVDNFKNTYKLFIKKLENNRLGWTYWQPVNNSAIIDMEPGMSSEVFRAVLLHELGHAFDLHFGEEHHYAGDFKSIMHPAIGNTDRLECPELLAFCDKYNCQVDCNFYYADPVYLQSMPAIKNSCETADARLTK